MEPLIDNISSHSLQMAFRDITFDPKRRKTESSRLKLLNFADKNVEIIKLGTNQQTLELGCDGYDVSLNFLKFCHFPRRNSFHII